MKAINLILSFVVLFAYEAQAVDLKINENYTVFWELEGEDTVVFEVTARTLGFIGFGLNSMGSMTSADIMVMGVHSNGTVYLQDMHATGTTTPILDDSQDCTLISGSENSTHTIVRFSRLLSTCDPDDYEIKPDTLSIIWSMGNTDTLGYHGATRGSRVANVLDPAMDIPDLEQFQIWDMRVNTVMPSVSTSYWCTMHKTPHFVGKHHMVGFNSILVGEEAVRHTHHIDIYKCTAPEGENATEIFDPFIGTRGVDCYDPFEEYFPHEYCVWIQYGWAIGGQITMFPEKLGFPLEPNDYYMLEIHYDNPTQRQGIQFETGMRMYFTEDVRDIDAGQFLVGSIINWSQMIPPNASDFITTAHCDASCTQEFPEDGVTVFNMLLHSHASGRKMKVRHFRDGVELPWIIVDDNYDFNYQQNRPMPQEFKVLRGDHLTTECTYDTNWKGGKAVIGGRATTEEMCIAFFFYYPKVSNIVECNSEVKEQDLMDFFGIESLMVPDGLEDPIITAPAHMYGLTFSQVVELTNWTPELRARYQQMARFGIHHGECIPHSEEFVNTTYPDFPVEYQPPETCVDNKKI